MTLHLSLLKLSGRYRLAPPRHARMIRARALLCAHLARSLHRDWLHVLLGSGAAVFTVVCIAASAERFGGNDYYDRGLFHYALSVTALQVASAIWAVLALGLRRHVMPTAHSNTAIFIDHRLAGWGLAVLLGLAVGSGRSLLISELVDFPAMLRPDVGDLPRVALPCLLSVLCAQLGIAMLVRERPSLRAAWFLLPAFGVALLCLALPGLGPCVLIVTIAAAHRQWKLAGAAVLAAVWIFGSFSYALAYPVAVKAAILLALAAGLGAAAWWRLRGAAANPL